MEKRDQVNQYTCEDCGRVITTINEADGVTPAFLRCRSKGCTGDMASAWYRVPQTLTPDHAWYKPTPAEQWRLNPATLEHVHQGGLLLRQWPAVRLRPTVAEQLRDWLGRDGLAFFREVKAEFGTVAATLPPGHKLNAGPPVLRLPHPIHFREGRTVRNWLREATNNEWDFDRYENGWVDLVEQAIAS